VKKNILIIFISALFFNHSFVFGLSNFSSITAHGDSLKTHPFADSLKKAPPDSSKNISDKSIIPIKQSGLVDSTNLGNISEKSFLSKTDYRYTGNFLSNIPFGFLRDLGSVGQPSEVLIYGQGFNNSSFLSDGINMTNRLTNSFDLNLYPSDDINKIEIIPLVQGFLFGSNNNTVSVNFISNDFELKKPYTRIHFYQAPNSEGFFDGIFSATFGRKVSLYTEITNQGTDSRYQNSEHSAWLSSTRLRYLLSDKINFIVNYRLASTNTQLNSGVDIDSLQSKFSADQVEEELYSYLSAPVNYENRYQKITSHNFSIKTLADIIPDSPTSLTLYYQTNLSEFRQNDSTNDDSYQKGILPIMDNNRYKTLGINFEQDFNYNLIHFRTIAGYENNIYTSPLFDNEINQNSFWVTAKAGFNFFGDRISSSAFAKYLNHDGDNFSGIGADLTFKLNENIKLYAGYSTFQKPGSVFQPTITGTKQRTNSFELAVNYSKDLLNIRTGYFNMKNNNAVIPAIVTNVSGDNLSNQFTYYFKTENTSLQGLNLKLEMKMWKVLFSTNSSYYFSDNDRNKFGIPQFTSSGGIYYIDTLFNSNLHLKTGFNYSLVGSRNNLYYDYERNISAVYSGSITPYTGSIPTMSSDSYPTDYQIDFFVSGQIQENATLYFTFENIFNRKYFIVPYYPLYERGIRFGIAWEFFD
jgi:outer membrane cobalamin receptor